MPVQRARPCTPTPLIKRIALRLAERIRELEPDAQIAVVNDWRKMADELTRALKKARRAYSERERSAANRGADRHPEIAGMSGAIFDCFYDYVYEGAAAGAGRELIKADASKIADAYRQVEAAVYRLAIDTRGTGGRLRLGLAAMPLHAVAIGYQCMRGSFGPSGLSIDVFDAVGKQKPQAKIAVLALAELGHKHAAIARGLNVDPADVRRALALAR